jgi:hypothetical protein
LSISKKRIRKEKKKRNTIIKAFCKEFITKRVKIKNNLYFFSLDSNAALFL